MGTFKLEKSRHAEDGEKPSTWIRVGNVVLVESVRWFTNVRWFAIAGLLAVGMAGMLFPDAIRNLGFAAPVRWPWVLAGVLAAANVGFFFMARRLRATSPPRMAALNIWIQMAVDLLVVTALVHLVGSTGTFIAFAYLFHIVLACIFFPTRESLLVTLFAAMCYMTCVILESEGVWPSGGVLLYEQGASGGNMLAHETTMAGSAVAVWLVVWYLVSHLARALRRRDEELFAANQLLIRVDHEMNQRTLQTTHDLKAPFSGIESSIQLLKEEHWGELPEAARSVVDSIACRAQTLRMRINDILLLGELRSGPAAAEVKEPADLQAVVRDVLSDLDELAKQRNVSVSGDIPSTTVTANARHLKVLFSNVIANAIHYSHDGGAVSINVHEHDGAVCVAVEDHGIGIPDEMLPRIFDEYFRTKEAARVNRLSTGLGLSIVREIAENEGLSVSVTSSVGVGTTFHVGFVGAVPGRQQQEAETGR